MRRVYPAFYLCTSIRFAAFVKRVSSLSDRLLDVRTWVRCGSRWTKFTEVQHFGDVAIVWSSYVVETEVDGKRSLGSSRVTEIFVWQHGRWTNPGWHTDEER